MKKRERIGRAKRGRRIRNKRQSDPPDHFGGSDMSVEIERGLERTRLDGAGRHERREGINLAIEVDRVRQSEPMLLQFQPYGLVLW